MWRREMRINTSYRTSYEEYNKGKKHKEPDQDDRTLHNYHLSLWSKPLPCGRTFDLKTNGKKPYQLLHNSDLGDFKLSSDAITHTYTGGTWDTNKKMLETITDIPKEEIAAFFDLCCTIGGYIIFPSNKIDNQRTINGERGMNHHIKDRFDLTLECIRLWYIGEKDPVKNPLSDCLERYKDFFELFSDFKGYVKFFLLDDLVDKDDKVRFWLPFGDFGKSPLPKGTNEYRKYMKNVS